MARRYGLRPYHFDPAEPFHIYRSVRERQPHLIRVMAMTMDERWVLRVLGRRAQQRGSGGHVGCAVEPEQFPWQRGDRSLVLGRWVKTT